MFEQSSSSPSKLVGFELYSQYLAHGHKVNNIENDHSCRSKSAAQQKCLHAEDTAIA